MDRLPQFHIKVLPIIKLYPDESRTSAKRASFYAPLPLETDELEVAFYERQSPDLFSEATLMDIGDKPPEFPLEGELDDIDNEKRPDCY